MEKQYLIERLRNCSDEEDLQEFLYELEFYLMSKRVLGEEIVVFG